MEKIQGNKHLVEKIKSLRNQITLTQFFIEAIDKNIEGLSLLRLEHSKTIEMKLNEIQELDEEKEAIFIEYLKQHPDHERNLPIPRN